MHLLTSYLCPDLCPHARLMYKLTGKCSEDSPLLTEEKRKLAHTSIVEVFCQLKRRERLSRSSPLAEHM